MAIETLERFLGYSRVYSFLPEAMRRQIAHDVPRWSDATRCRTCYRRRADPGEERVGAHLTDHARSGGAVPHRPPAGPGRCSAPKTVAAARCSSRGSAARPSGVALGSRLPPLLSVSKCSSVPSRAQRATSPPAMNSTSSGWTITASARLDAGTASSVRWSSAHAPCSSVTGSVAPDLLLVFIE
jgi:hypothetical protein